MSMIPSQKPIHVFAEQTEDGSYCLKAVADVFENILKNIPLEPSTLFSSNRKTDQKNQVKERTQRTFTVGLGQEIVFLNNAVPSLGVFSENNVSSDNVEDSNSKEQSFFGRKISEMFSRGGTEEASSSGSSEEAPSKSNPVSAADSNSPNASGKSNASEASPDGNFSDSNSVDASVKSKRKEIFADRNPFLVFDDVEDLLSKSVEKEAAGLYGWIKGLIPAPHKDDIYLVKFNTEGVKNLATLTFRILAYVDRFGRVFQASQTVEMPPAWYPKLAFAYYDEDGDDSNGNARDINESEGQESGDARRQSGGQENVTQDSNVQNCSVRGAVQSSGEQDDVRDGTQDVQDDAQDSVKDAAQDAAQGSQDDAQDAIQGANLDANQDTKQSTKKSTKRPSKISYIQHGRVQQYNSEGEISVAADYTSRLDHYNLYNNWFNFQAFATNMSLNEALARAYFALEYRPKVQYRSTPSCGFNSISNLLQGTNAVAAMHNVCRFVQSSQEDSAQQVPELAKVLCRYLEDAGLLEAWERTCRKKGHSGVCINGGPLYSRQYHLYGMEGCVLSPKELWTLESALNSYDALCRTLGDEAMQATMSDYSLAEVYAYTAFPLQLGETLYARSQEVGEWLLRISIGKALEDVCTPLCYDAGFKADIATGTVSFVCIVPNENMMPKSYWDREQQCWKHYSKEDRKQAALAYAQRIGLMLAGIVCCISNKIKSISVAAQWFLDDFNSNKFDLAYDVLFDADQLRKPGVYKDAVIDPSQFYSKVKKIGPTRKKNEHPVQSLRGNSLFWPVTSQPSYDRFFVVPDVVTRSYSAAANYALGCDNTCNMAINYNANRRIIAEEVADRLTTMKATSEGIEYLQQIQDAYSDPDILQACTRLMTKLTQGNLRMDNEKQLVEGFLGEIPFESVLEKLQEYASAAQTQEGLELISENLDDIKECMSEMRKLVDEAYYAGAYSDDSRCVYRMFDASSSRVLYNLARSGRLNISGITETVMEDQGKVVKLVPDGYYHCCLELTRLLSQDLGQLDDTLRYGMECLRVAPTVTLGYRQLSQAYLMLGDLKSSRNLLITALNFATDHMEIAWLYFQLANVEWKMTHIKTAQACYLRAIAVCPDIASVTGKELNKLVQEARLGFLPIEHIDPIMRSAGIPIAPRPEILNTLFTAAQAAIDEGLFLSGSNLLSVILRHQPDGALFHVLRSIEDDG